MSRPVLIIQLAKLGDFIQSTALLAKIRRDYSGSSIILAAGQPAVREAGRLSSLIDIVPETVETASLKSLEPFAAIFVLNSHPEAALLAAGLRSADHFGPRLADGELIFTPAQRFLMAIVATRRDLGRFNLVDVWASLLSGVPSPPVSWPMAAPKPGVRGRDGIGRIGFQLASRSHLRRWPVERFTELFQHLAVSSGRNPALVLLGSAEEKAIGTRFERLVGASVENLMGATDLKELGEAVGGLDLLITGDTGVMHLAAAVGTPVLSLFFGPAYGPETGPYGPGHIIYQAAADCAPCRENADCRRRQCLKMPDAAIAADLALARLKGGSEDNWPIESSLPAGHLVWSIKGDGFGQSLKPLGRPCLTTDEALALILTEAGRPIINSAYQPDENSLADIFSAYADDSQGLTLDLNPLNIIVSRAFQENINQRKKFLEVVTGLAGALGFKIAKHKSGQ